MEGLSQPLYPVDHLSYTALKTFLSNRFMFRRKYILKIYDGKTSPSSLAGKAMHKALEVILKGGSTDEGMGAALALIAKTPDEWMDWGKTGTREKVIETATQAINFYLAEMPKWNVVDVEKSITTFIEVNGVKMGLPAKAVIDLVIRNEANELELIDHKSCSSFTDAETERGDFMLQALFCYHVAKAEYGEAPKRMRFRECKTSKNKDGSAQVQEYVIEFDQHQDYQQIFYALYDQVSVELTDPNLKYLPNFADQFEGPETFKHFAATVTSMERPVAVAHKKIHREFVDAKYVPSANDVVDNAFLTDEEKVRMKLLEFGMAVEMKETLAGPNVLKFTMKPSRGIPMAKFENHAKDIAIALKATSVRIEAPIMGTDLIGIEVPNPERRFISLTEAASLPGYTLEKGTMRIPIGVDVYGNVVVKDLADMPHLIVAGATGSGKSVMLNVIIRALMGQNTPDQLKFVLIDPKRVELSQYKNEPHVLAKPIYDTMEAINALKWLVDTMEARYGQLEQVGARNIEEYNEMNPEMERIVVVVDEFADLILQRGGEEAEVSIVRLTQKARAVGIHVIIGTQRPTVDVVTGLIKANCPTRIAFSTAQKVDSQVILDRAGAEELCGKGDLLFLDPARKDLIRLQALYVAS